MSSRFFWSYQRTAGCRPTGGNDYPPSFPSQEVSVQLSIRSVTDKRGGALSLRPRKTLLSPNRPTSIRTLYGAISSGASWVSSILNGRCFLGAELNASVSRGIIPSACRSHPNSAILHRLQNLRSSSFLLLLSCLLISQGLVDFTGHPESMEQDT